MTIWNELGEMFDVHGDTIDPNAADNILLAWPDMLTFIEQHVPQSGRILDFGCGTGGLVKELVKRGYQADGIDDSSVMIEKAVAQDISATTFSVGDETDLATISKPYDAITSVMVLQFIEDIDTVFKNAAHALTENGVFVFAVFNPDYIQPGADAGYIFEDIDGDVMSDAFSMHMNVGASERILTYIRTESWYTQHATSHGFEHAFTATPEYTQEYIEKYHSAPEPTHVPKFLLLGYRKV